ncbi:flagellar biosynthesis protein FlhF [Congregibacter litoralis]|uniref:Flagellar biosynthesis protein FlhF n=1 Tax=Congregibacter litoralis KT71 TaxID=314285 RepID=A4A5Y1_9GAMM|nr:flagellar biosynthesis protein FlhF [Congregibacter litoralis]EAQ98428.2 flagellar biosynthetic protein FlhF [Congregibacter litoralis KT71]
MRIEKYTAKDSRSAMAQVRAELGADALILANRRVAGLIEITAAVDVEQAVNGATPRASKRPAREREAVSTPTNEIQLKALERELQRLRGILDKELGTRSWQEAANTRAPQSVLRQRLLRMGLSRKLAGALLDHHASGKRVEAGWRQVLAALAERLQASDLEQLPGNITAVYGGTGVGKTSTVARLAGRDIQRLGPEMVGLITLDNYRIGAQEQLASFADALGIPLFSASDRHTLSLALRKMQGRRIYIDTAGMSQHDARLQGQYALIRELRKPVRHLMVLAASAQPSQCRALAANFAPHTLSGAIISKVDEAQSLGGVLDVLISSQLPVLGYSDGQRIPEDLRRTDGMDLVRRAVQLTELGNSPTAGQSLRAAV